MNPFATLTRQESKMAYEKAMKENDKPVLRTLCQEDLFFLLYIACNRRDVDHPWIYDRCREVEKAPDGFLDLWSREHYKSTISFALMIQDILKDPNVTIGIFSHTRPIAKKFLAQLKRELETNMFLQDLFPDVLYVEPHKESPVWSLDNGIIVRRTENPKEATVEAWGLVDGQPTSKHYKILVYDDIVTRESVTTPEMIQKVTDGWALSLNLGSGDCKKRYYGSRYHQSDSYAIIMDRKAAKPRIYPCTVNGQVDGEPVLMSKKQVQEKYESMGTYIFSAQMLLNPRADSSQNFDINWLRRYDIMKNYDKWNKYIIVDAANAKKRSSDFTVMAVIALAPDKNYYLLHAIRDRMNLTERQKALFSLVRQWEPIHVGYEEFGMMADRQHIEYVQEQENFRFHIVPLTGAMPKVDRIKRLVPIMQMNRFWFPHTLQFIALDGKVHDFMREFVDDEYKMFPVCSHDDMLDCISRILDMEMRTVFPNLTMNTPATLPLTPQAEFAQHDYNPLDGPGKK